MSPEPVVAERSYILLKADIMAGRFPPGSMLIERALAAEYGVSVSPFRDGAQRLVGEHMLEIAFGGGYRLPDLTPDSLRDLYRWHSHLLRLVLKGNRLSEFGTARPHPQAEMNGQALAKAATDLFLSVAWACHDSEQARALKSATERLHMARLGEFRVLRNLTSELRSVEIATTSGQGSDRFEVLWAYHRRRIRRVERICESITS